MKNIIIAFCALVFLVSCKKEILELPSDTQNGDNTFGAKVEGVFWVPQGFGPFPAGNLLVVRNQGNEDFYIHARNFSTSPTETEFEIFLKNVTGPGIYLLNTNVGYPSSSSSYAYYVKRRFTPIDEWITSATHTGSVIITKFDLTTKILSGTFQFTAVSIYDPTKLLSVTEGRFDLKIP